MVFIMSDTNNNDSIDLNEESAIVNDTLGNINCLGALEALLFAVGEAVEINKLADSIGVKPKDIENAYEELNKRYDSDDYGIRIIKLDDKLQLCTKNMYYDKLINLVQQMISLEVLVYLQWKIFLLFHLIRFKISEDRQWKKPVLQLKLDNFSFK